jgi:hypothetical protein
MGSEDNPPAHFESSISFGDTVKRHEIVFDVPLSGPVKEVLSHCGILVLVGMSISLANRGLKSHRPFTRNSRDSSC